MRREPEILERATELVRNEQMAVHTEREAFEEFRESVRLVQPLPSDQAETSNTGRELVQTYRDTVLSTNDFGAMYGETLEEHLERELSPTLADILVSNDAVTQRRKRDLLLVTSNAIEERTRFIENLQTELDSISTFAESIARVRTEIDSLPECTFHGTTFEKFHDIWQRYHELEQCCEQLMMERQRQILEPPRNLPDVDAKHALNLYLYRELKTPYPLLRTVTQTYILISDMKFENGSPESPISLSVAPFDK